MVRLADNLVANAIRHTDSGKEILLAALSSDEHLSQEVFPVFKEELDEWRKGGTIILIQNEGNSIPEPMQEKIFLPFVQVDGSRGHAMGSSTRQVIWRVLLPEARPGLLASITITIVTLVSYTAMSGLVGGGGLGDLAIRYGYHRYETEVMIVAVVLMVLLVQLLQMAGDRLVRHFTRK